jgi:lipid-A-disaccharide synthase
MGLRVGLVAGEASGDLLGAGLIEAIRERVPDARFEGIAGPRMVAAGCRAFAQSERLAVMGLVEPLGRLPELLRLRHRLARYFLDDPPDVFVGIDAPDFNLALERKLREGGIPAVHYVSPSVWAWRQYRVRKIARSVDAMLTLFPFEADFYRTHGVPVTFVGHPLAESIPDRTDPQAARQELGLRGEGPVLALLPGSRLGEINRLGRDFLMAAAQLSEDIPGLRVIAPMASASARTAFEAQWQQVAPRLGLQLFDGRSHEVMAAADAVLLASGTAALEAMLLKRPMVVAYRLAGLTYTLLRRLKLMQVDRYSLPNLLAQMDVVPELIQDAVTPQALAAAVGPLLRDVAARERQLEVFDAIHHQLRAGGSAKAADAVLALARGQD